MHLLVHIVWTYHDAGQQNINKITQRDVTRKNNFKCVRSWYEKCEKVTSTKKLGILTAGNFRYILLSYVTLIISAGIFSSLMLVTISEPI